MAKRSKKTTMAGIATFVGLLLVGLGSMFDGDPSTTVDWVSIVGAGVAAVGALSAGWFGRDNDVTSEDVAQAKAENAAKKRKG